MALPSLCKANLLFFTFVSLTTNLFLAQPSYPQWAATYGEMTSLDSASSIQQTNDGGYIVAGWTDSFGAGESDIWVLKLDANGGIVWQNKYGGDSYDHANSVRQTSDGGYIVAGRTDSFGAGESDIWVLKLDANGGVAWQKKYGGAYTKNDGAYSIQQTRDGGYIVAGWIDYPSSDLWVLKLDTKGCVVWQKKYDGTSIDEAHSIQQTSDGGYIVAGMTTSFGAGESDIWVLKLDANGDVVWQKTYGGNSYDRASSIQQTRDGGCIVAGWTDSFGAGESDIWVLKLDANGDIVWQKTYGEYSYDKAFSIQQTSDNGYVVAGYCTYSLFPSLDRDIWILKLDANGGVVWQKTYGGAYSDEAASIQQTSDGGYIVAGVTNSFGAGGSDFWVLKLRSNGTIDSSCNFIGAINISVGVNSSAIVKNTTVSGQSTNAFSQISTAAVVVVTTVSENILCYATPSSTTTATQTTTTTTHTDN